MITQNDKYIIAYLHQIGLSQAKLRDIFITNNLLLSEVINYIKTKSFTRLKLRPSVQTKVVKNLENFTLKNLISLIQKQKINICIYDESDYPIELNNLNNPPYIVYIKGELSKKPGFGIVGSRKMTHYGQKIIKEMVPELTKHFSIISGGASGCDSMAHEIALESNGHTTMVIGTGIDRVYPSSNTELCKKVINSGAIVSIFPVGEPGNPYNFPIRNEIIAALSRGVLLPECSKKSGTLITAKLALDLGKDVFAMPGNYNSLSSEGTNIALQKGEAKLTLNINDILEEYNFNKTQSLKNTRVNLECSKHQSIYEILLNGATSLEKLASITGMTTSELMTNLSLLEMKKIIRKNLFGEYEIF